MAKKNNPKTFKKGRIPFKEAKLREYPSGWVIEFHYMDVDNDRLERHRLKRNRVREQAGDDRRARVEIYCECKDINRMLGEGWTPKCQLVTEDLHEESVTYLAQCFLEDRENTKRIDTIRSYRSILKRFLLWMKNNGMEKLSVYDFTPQLALKFSDALKRMPDIGPKTFNNNISVISAFWNWIIDERFIEVKNHFKRIKKMRETSEPRDIIPEEYDQSIFNYCATHDPALQLIIQLIYAPSFMRISELGKTKLKYINFKEKIISLPAHSEKTHKEVI